MHIFMAKSPMQSISVIALKSKKLIGCFFVMQRVRFAMNEVLTAVKINKRKIIINKNICQKWDLNPRPHTRTRTLTTRCKASKVSALSLAP